MEKSKELFLLHHAKYKYGLCIRDFCKAQSKLILNSYNEIWGNLTRFSGNAIFNARHAKVRIVSCLPQCRHSLENAECRLSREAV